MNEVVCKLVSERIINALDEGVVPWRKRWVDVCDMAFSYSTKRPYSLLNQFLLGERAGEYLTFNQVKESGGSVKKGAKSQKVVFWKILKYKQDDEDNVGEEKTKTVPLLKYYNVFHIDDCEGVKSRFTEEMPDVVKEERDAETVIDSYIKRENLTLERSNQCSRAFYSRTNDVVTIPAKEQFFSTAEYYATLFHELIHSTGHSKRLARHSGKDKSFGYGSESYSCEELVAEIGASILMTTLGIETDKQFKNSVAYIKGWRYAIAKDNSLIVTATGRAEKAVKYILGTLDNNIEE